MLKWEYITTPLLLHRETAILNNWGSEGWELVQIVTDLSEGRSYVAPSLAIKVLAAMNMPEWIWAKLVIITELRLSKLHWLPLVLLHRASRNR